MRLYTTDGATQFDDPEYGTFKADADGAFDGLPDGMYAKLHGRPGWENDAERVARLAAEQMEKLRDPATMLAELQKMSAGQGALTALLANALGVGPSSDAEAAPSGTPAASPAADAAQGATPAPSGEPAAPAAKSSRVTKKAASSPSGS